MLKVTIQTRQKGSAKQFLSRVRRALSGPKRVKVGFPAGKASSDVVARATYNEFGTSRGIPERPFMRNAMADNRGDYGDMARASARAIVKGSLDMPRALDLLGKRAVDDIKGSIDSNIGPANAPSTIKRKGSSGTLRDTSEMKNSVTHDLD